MNDTIVDEDHKSDANPQIIKAISVEIKQIDHDTQVQPKEDDKNAINRDIVRWDLILLFYFIAICITACAFGLSIDGDYNRIIFFWGIIHFSAESVVSFYLLYSQKYALILSWIIVIICLIESLIYVPIGNFDNVSSLFSFQFYISDTLVVFTCCVIAMNPLAPKLIRSIGFGIGFHSVGILMAYCHVPIKFYIQNKIPQHGYPWLLLIVVIPIQLYVTKDILMSKANHISFNNIKWPNHKLRMLAQIGVPLVTIFVTLAGSIAGIFRTTENETGRTFASTTFLYIISGVGFPIGLIGIIIAAYLWQTGRIPYYNTFKVS